MKKNSKNIDYFRKYADVSLLMARKKSEVKSGKGLRTFLNERIFNANQFARENNISKSAVYAALHGENKNIRINTLEKIIQGLQLKRDFNNPKILNYTIQNMDEKRKFERLWGRLKNLSVYRLKRFFLKNFMTLTPYHKIEIHKLLTKCSGDKIQLFKYIHSNKNLVFLANIENTEIQFYRARMNLIIDFLNDLESEKTTDDKEDVVLRKYMNQLFKVYSLVKSFGYSE